jgi:hypothetical protein
MKKLFSVFAAAALGACATPGVSISQDAKPRKPVPESSGVTRGRAREYRAPLTIENAHVLSDADFRELQNNFLNPLQTGPWRYAIEGITMDAESDQEREWTLLIALDTGARIKVENFGAWDEETRSHFRGGYLRARRALEMARAQDPSLDRYGRFWSSKRTRAAIPAETQVPEDADE